MKNRSQFKSGHRGPPPGRQQAAPAAPAMSAKLTALFGQALALHQAGRIMEAEPPYRQVLQAQPRNFDSLHLLGVIHYQRAEYEEAVRQIEAALRINRNV